MGFINRAHPGQEGPAHADDAIKIDVDQAFKIGHFNVLEHPAQRDTGIVEEEMDRRAAGFDILCQPGNGRGIGHVDHEGRDRTPIRPQRCRDAIKPVCIDIDQDEAGTARSQSRRQRCTNAAGGPGDQRRPAGIIEAPAHSAASRAAS